MRNLEYIVVLLITTFIFNGCGTNQYRVTYNSNPPGATLNCYGKNRGYTPITLNYQLDDKSKENKFFYTEPCTANWISGLSKDYDDKIDLEKFPEGVMQTLERPRGEGYEKDAQFGIQVQMMKSQQSQAQAAQMNAYFNQQRMNQQGFQNLNNSLNNSWNETQMQMQNMQMQNLNNNLKNLNNNLNQMNGNPWVPQW